ncbi:uncharacterized protein LOC123706863 isoform X2 [Pieris brassicae]|uniref:Uncharacterized protein n=1 Tax=Pieris brassicae TaxID=7116 RepID=A0A9P0T631_PIEBR|nr:uncharacterized protein LOC123706863 isoform X2 [Pieris brassicae]CAH4015352.1 unnamed protein product [Pieris brassicae]
MWREGGSLKVVIPKARRGIHDLNPIMRNTPELSTSRSQETRDEVDNIMSKPARSSSPISVRKQLPRRSSVDAELSDKSVDTDSEDENYQYIHSHRDVSLNTSWQNYSRSSETNIPENQDKINSGLNSKYIIPIVIALCGICYIVYGQYSDKNISFKIYDRINFYDDLKSMAQKYKVKPDSMLQVRTGVDTIFQKEDAGSFIFTYDSKSFDSELFFNFIDNISSASSRYLRNDTKDVQHVVLDSSKVITIKSDVDLIYEFRDNLDKTGVLLVKNIERVPAKLAMAFHYYCDEFNPLVKKSAIFFTLDVSKCKSLLGKPSLDHDYIERCLKEIWREVDRDKIAPLLTRVVGVIVDVTNL